MLYTTLVPEDKVRVGHEKGGLTFDLDEAENLALELLGACASRKLEPKNKSDYFLRLSATLHKASLAALPRMTQQDQTEAWHRAFARVDDIANAFGYALVKVLTSKISIAEAIRGSVSGAYSDMVPSLVRNDYRWERLRQALVGYASGALPRLARHISKAIRTELDINIKGWPATVKIASNVLTGQPLAVLAHQIIAEEENRITDGLRNHLKMFAISTVCLHLKEGCEAIGAKFCVIQMEDQSLRRVPVELVAKTNTARLPCN